MSAKQCPLCVLVAARLSGTGLCECSEHAWHCKLGGSLFEYAAVRACATKVGAGAHHRSGHATELHWYRAMVHQHAWNNIIVPNGHHRDTIPPWPPPSPPPPQRPLTIIMGTT
eukprot:4090637-Pyramimonas_sp.AAC.1